MPGSPALLALAMLAAPRSTELPREPGVWWEHTISMTMSGFSVPPRTQKICVTTRQDRWLPPEDQGQQGCKMEDLKRSGSKTSWTMVCAGGIRAQGEVTFSGDRYEGTQTMTMPAGEARMTMSGRKIGGDCDANQTRRQVAAQVEEMESRQAAAARAAQAAEAEECDRALRDMDSVRLANLAACKQKKAAFCARYETREGFSAVQPRSPQEAAAEQLCGKSAATVLAKLCRDTVAEHGKAPVVAAKKASTRGGGAGSPADDDPDAFLAARCPVEARPIALRECAGRSYTGMEERTRAFCTAFVRARLEAGESVAEFQPSKEPAKTDESPAKKEAVEQGKKLIKGLLPW